MDPLLPFRTLSPGSRRPKAALKPNRNSKLSLKTWKKPQAVKDDKENNVPVTAPRFSRKAASKLVDSDLMTSDESSESSSYIGKTAARQFSLMSLNTQESTYALPIAESTRREIPDVHPTDSKMTTLYTAHSDNSSSGSEYYTAHPALGGCDDSIVCLSDSSSEIVEKVDKKTSGMAKCMFDSVLISSDESDCDLEEKNPRSNILSSLKKVCSIKIHETVILETDSESDSNDVGQRKKCNRVIPASPQNNGSFVDSPFRGSNSSIERRPKSKGCGLVIPPSPRSDSESSLISQDIEKSQQKYDVMISSVIGKQTGSAGRKAPVEQSMRSSIGSIVSSSVIGEPQPVWGKRSNEKPSQKAKKSGNVDETELNESSWKEDFHLVMPEVSVASDKLNRSKTPSPKIVSSKMPATISKQKYDDIARWLFFGRESSEGTSNGESSKPNHREQQVLDEQSQTRESKTLKNPRVSKLSVVRKSSFGSESDENFNALLDSVRKKRNDVKKRNVPSDDSFINDASDVEEPHALTNYHSELTKSIKAEVKSAKKSVKSIKKQQNLGGFEYSDAEDSDEVSDNGRTNSTADSKNSKPSFKSERKCTIPSSSTDDSDSEIDIPKKGNKIIYDSDSSFEDKRVSLPIKTDKKAQTHSKNVRRNIVVKTSDEESSTSSRLDSGLKGPTKPKSVWRKSVDMSDSSSTSGSSNATSSPELKPPKGPTRKVQRNPPQAVLRKVPPVTPKQVAALRSPQTPRSPVRTFLSSLSGPSHQPGVRDHPEAAVYNKNFKGKKEELTRRLFKLFNREVFEGRLPQDMVLEWNPRLVRTAGLCYCKLHRKNGVTTRTAKIGLSTKVITSPDRLRDTLIHEMCHAAVWLLNNVSGGHGPYWKAWAFKGMKRFPELPLIERCHSYQIETKFTYKCTVCAYSFGRHSKSLNLEKKRCGYCYGKFEVFVNSNHQNQQKKVLKTPKAPSAFALFVKENYGVVKQESSNLKHGDIMKKLGEKFTSLKVKQHNS